MTTARNTVASANVGRHHYNRPMTRSDLITRVAKKFPRLVQIDAQFSVDLILDSIAQALIEGRRVEIRNFGSFSVHHRPARVGRNPKTGEAVSIPEKHVPHFKPGKGLQDSIQSSESRSAAPETRQRNAGAATATLTA